MRSYIPKDVRLIPENAKRVFKGVIFDVYHWEQELYDGSFSTFEMLKRPDTVEVLAVKDGKIVVQEQEQPGTGMFFDFPCGRHDVESETELEAVKRELLEETGMSFKNWKLVDVHQPHKKIDWLIYTFVATDFIDQVNQKLDAGEKIKVTLKSVEEIKELQKDERARYLGNRILKNIDSIDQLANLAPLN